MGMLHPVIYTPHEEKKNGPRRVASRALMEKNKTKNKTKKGARDASRALVLIVEGLVVLKKRKPGPETRLGPYTRGSVYGEENTGARDASQALVLVVEVVVVVKKTQGPETRLGPRYSWLW
jgi:hypothetical protein